MWRERGRRRIHKHNTNIVEGSRHYAEVMCTAAYHEGLLAFAQALSSWCLAFCQKPVGTELGQITEKETQIFVSLLI